MNCPKCGSENADNSKFCRTCGERLHPGNDKATHPPKENKTDNNKKIIIALTAIIVILLAGVLLYASGVLGSNVELETQEFDGFKLDVPVDSKFVLSDSYTTDPNNIFVGYINNGGYTPEVFAFQAGTNVSESIIESVCELDHVDGDLKVYKNESDGYVYYNVFKKGDKANISIFGDDVNTIKRMAKSFEDKDFDKLYTASTEPVTQTTQSTQTTAPSTGAMSILGGSISTGSELSDKTYASIYVGPGHAGKSVTVQIWYSRDGSTLNNGNMVPVTVDSSGYVDVASADAYSLFPDFAEINLYDSAGKLLDTRSVSLSPESGTQSF